MSEIRQDVLDEITDDDLLLDSMPIVDRLTDEHSLKMGEPDFRRTLLVACLTANITESILTYENAKPKSADPRHFSEAYEWAQIEIWHDILGRQATNYESERFEICFEEAEDILGQYWSRRDELARHNKSLLRQIVKQTIRNS